MNTIRQVGNTYEIQLSHPNGEKRWLPIESWVERYVTVRWELAGSYDVMLKDGRVIARSAKTRQRNPHNPWTGNVEELREFVAERMGIKRDEFEERFRNHHASMPGQRKCAVNYESLPRGAAVNDAAESMGRKK